MATTRNSNSGTRKVPMRLFAAAAAVVVAAFSG